MLGKGHYHLVGAAGVGMSALAQAVGSQGCRVTGSDRDFDRGENEIVIRKLKADGIEMFPQDGSGIDSKTAGVVISTAIESDNPDVSAASKYKIPVIHRSEMIQRIVGEKQCVAVTGTAGKSTVTGMIGWMLDHSGLCPNVINGAGVLNWMTETAIGNFKAGSSDLWVIEADESDKSLMTYSPDWAVITNVSMDHFSMEESQELFRKFEKRVKKEAVSCLDRPEWLRLFNPNIGVSGSIFIYKDVRFDIPLPGIHNAENALFAVVMCDKLGVPLRKIATAMKKFKGIHRRLELIGTVQGITVIDDYAHNPAKIHAACKAVIGQSKRLIMIWRPHGYKPLSSMMEELVAVMKSVCRDQDRIFILPVYDAGGTANRTVNGDKLVERLVSEGVHAEFVIEPEDLPVIIKSLAAEGDVILSMGARDPRLNDRAQRILAAIK